MAEIESAKLISYVKIDFSTEAELAPPSIKFPVSAAAQKALVG